MIGKICKHQEKYIDECAQQQNECDTIQAIEGNKKPHPSTVQNNGVNILIQFPSSFLFNVCIYPSFYPPQFIQTMFNIHRYNVICMFRSLFFLFLSMPNKIRKFSFRHFLFPFVHLSYFLVTVTLAL